MTLKINNKQTKPVTLPTQRRHPLTLTIVTALGLAASASYMRTGYAGSCSYTGLTILCSDPAGGGNDTTQSFIESDSLTVTTEAGFGLNVASGDGLTLRGNSAGTGDLIFLDDNASSITGNSSGIFAFHQGSGALSITTSGTVEGANFYGINVVTNTTASDSTIEAKGDVTGGNVGIDANHQGSGALSITTSGTVEGTNYYGLSVRNATTSSDVTINAEGDVTAGNIAIYANHNGTGAVSITVDAAVTGDTSWGVFIGDGAVGSNDNRLTISTAAVIQGGGGGRCHSI